MVDRLTRNASAMASSGYCMPSGLASACNKMRPWSNVRAAPFQGLAMGQCNLGFMYAEGRGVAKDETEAVRLFQLSAAQGYALGQYGMGLMYEHGWGVARDLVEAQRRFTQAAEIASFASDRNKAMQAYERVTRQLAPAQPPTPHPVSATPPTPISFAPSASPIAAASPSEPRHRRALVIGNASYPDTPLRNPINDAMDIADTLRHLGFDVTLHQDADKPTMEKAINLFTQAVPHGSAGLFFFAGHGVQIEGVNYLVPIDARLNAASDVKYHAVVADWVLARMDESGMDAKLLLLDACRNNPLGRSWTRALSRGLAVMETPKGALIAYATSPGKTALDGQGRNSPFTGQLLRELGRPGRDIEVALKAVRAGVQQTTQGQQIPWVASSMTGDLYLGR